MRRFLFLIVLFTSLNVSAQQIRFGFKGGLDLTKMEMNSSVFNSTNQTGFFIGPTLFIGGNSGLGFEFSGLLDHRSVEIESSNEAYSNQTLKQDQFVVPIHVRYSVGIGSTGNIFVYGGPQFGFSLGNKIKNYEEAKSIVKEWRLRESNYSVNAGAGFTIGHIQVTANYNVPLGRTGDATFRDTVDGAVDGFNNKITTRSWQVGVAYLF